jgi:hypothetical protein
LSNINKTIDNKDVNIISESKQIKSNERPLDIKKLEKYIQILKSLLVIMDKYIELMLVNSNVLEKKDIFDMVTIRVNSLIKKIQLLLGNKTYNKILDEIVDMLFISELPDGLSVKNEQKGGGDDDIPVTVVNKSTDVIKTNDKIVDTNDKIMDDIIDFLFLNALGKPKSLELEELLYDEILSEAIILFDNIKHINNLETIIVQFFNERYTKYNYNEDEMLNLISKILLAMEILIKDKVIQEGKEGKKGECKEKAINQKGQIDPDILKRAYQSGLQDGKIEATEKYSKNYNLKDISSKEYKPIDADACANTDLNANDILIGRMDDKCLIYNTTTGKTEEPQVK